MSVREKVILSIDPSTANLWLEGHTQQKGTSSKEKYMHKIVVVLITLIPAFFGNDLQEPSPFA